MGTIGVLGLGPSRDLFKPDEYECSIGVNDIWRYIETDVIVCVDKPKVFTPERLNVINNSKPMAFYSQSVAWDTRSDFVQIRIQPGYPENGCILDINAMAKSYCSPFVACQVAFWYYSATEIHLFGVDLLNHPHLNQEICAKIKVHFSHLRKALKERGCEMVIHGNGILTK